MKKYKCGVERYKRVMKAANDVIWEWNLNKNEIYFSEKLNEVVGYDRSCFSNLIDFIDKIVVSEDKHKAMDELENCLLGQSVFYQSTYKIRTKNGTIKWIQLKGKIFENQEDKTSLFSGVMTDVTENIKLQDQIRHMAYYDGLTELPNRRLFFKRLNILLEKAKNENKQGALIFFDIDNFKMINDSYGHKYGDMVLKIFAQLLDALTVDYGEIARLSGDEFVVLLYDFKDIQCIKRFCDSIQEYLKNYFEIEDKQIYVSVSIGVTIFPEHSKDQNELIKFADFAMYQSKFKGKKQYNFFSKDIAEEYFRIRLIEEELKNSIKNNELSIYYQPQIDVDSNNIIGIEALLRWKNNKLGYIGPQEFIAIAEKTGFIIELGNWVLENVLYTTYFWKQKGYKFDTIAINISPLQIKDKNFKEKVVNLCKKYSIPHELLELEITEGTLIDIRKERIQILEDIIKAGINIAIDDFGTGYSSLNYLTSLPVNKLKIDKSFIDNIENAKNLAVIKTIISLSEALNYTVITEGVETERQVKLLKKLGCNIIQGYFYSKPLPEKEIEKLLIRQSKG